MFRAVIALLIFALLPSAAKAEKRIALLIGNKDYAQAVGPLKNPHKDVAVVAKALAKIGFAVMPEVKDATREQLLIAVHEFADNLKAAGPEAVGFIYYSGHGLALAGQNYLVPVDVDEANARMLSVRGVTHGEVISILEDTAPEAVHYLVFDACRNNLGGWRGAKGFVPERQRSGIMIAFSTAPGTTASDEGLSGGPYATALAAELVKPGQSDLYMFHKVRVTVDRKTNGDQVPWIEDGIRRRDRIQFGGKSRIVPPDEAKVAWSFAKGTTDIALLESFAARYPNSSYTVLARARIEELKKKQNNVPVLPKIQRSPERPFDGYWIVKATAITGCEQKTWENRIAIQDFAILFANTKRGQVDKDGSFTYTRSNRNFPDLLVTMAGRLDEKGGKGTYATGACQGTLVLVRE
jgi:uncharacterized caspase-like protein